jgi:hypothetical protein
VLSAVDAHVIIINGGEAEQEKKLLITFQH